MISIMFNPNPNRYHINIGLDGEKCLARGSHCPTAGRLKNFLAWYVETSKGTLRSKPTQVSMKNRLRDLCAMIYQETGTKIPKVLNEHVCGVSFAFHVYFNVNNLLVHRNRASDNTRR